MRLDLSRGRRRRGSGGWVDYTSPAVAGLASGEPIVNPDGLKVLLALKRDGEYLTPGVLNNQNKLDGEGPFRIVPPQVQPGPPDQRSTAANQDVIWPFDETADHNAGYSTRSTTIIRVEPLPEGTTDIDLLEAGWGYADQNKIVVYGAIAPMPAIVEKLDGMMAEVLSADDGDFRSGADRSAMVARLQIVEEMAAQGDYSGAWQQVMEGIVGATTSGKGGFAGPIANRELEQKLYWGGSEVAAFLKIAGS